MRNGGPESPTAPDPPIKLGLNERNKLMRPRLFRLLEMHQRLDDDLQQEMRRRWPNQLRIVELKKLKLRVKDHLYGFIRQPQNV
jgi:uncharacterized protein YdcH (DUF465 family)